MVYWLKCQISRTSMFKSPSPTMGTWQMTLGDSCALCCADKMEEERMTFMASLAPHWEKSRWKCVRKLLLLGAEWHTDGLKSHLWDIFLGLNTVILLTFTCLVSQIYEGLLVSIIAGCHKYQRIGNSALIRWSEDPLASPWLHPELASCPDLSPIWLVMRY